MSAIVAARRRSEMAIIWTK